MEITKREILASVSIFFVMLLIGILISSKISQYQMDKNEIYNKAVKISSQEMFEYGMKTNVGNAFVYGNLEAVDTVTYPEIGGEYLYIEKVKERYTMHTRRVKSGKTYHTQIYYTWDRAGSEEKHSKKIKFMNNEFDYSKISHPSSDYIDMVKESITIRYKYYGCPIKYTGTIFTSLKNNTINGSIFYEKPMDKAIEDLESGVGLVVFWIFWIILIIGCIVGFYYLENRWLD